VVNPNSFGKKERQAARREAFLSDKPVRRPKLDKKEKEGKIKLNLVAYSSSVI